MTLAELKQKFKGQITTDEATLRAYSKDASIFEIHPKIVCAPEDAEDIRTLISFVNQNKNESPELSLTVRAGGTCMTGGAINDSIIIDSKNLNKIANLTDESVWTEPGVFFRDLEPKLLARNVIMPAYPSSKAWAAMGGMAANNAGGEKTFSYGQCINYVQELKAVLADGNEYLIRPLSKSELDQKMSQPDFEGNFYKSIYNLINENYQTIQKAKPTTSKNAAGYYLWDVWDGQTFDLTKIFVGSQGTLGIITNIKWKLVPLKRHRQLAIFYLDNLNQLGEIVNTVNALGPESHEIFDKQTFRIALRYLPEMAERMGRSTLSLVWKFRKDLFNWLAGQLPEIVLLAEFTGNSREEAINKANQAIEQVQTKFNISGRIAKDLKEAKRFWSIRRESYNLLRHHSASKISAPFIEDIVVHPDQLPEFMPQVNAIIAKYPDFVYTIAGHAGDANFHIIPLVNLQTPQHRKQLIEISDKIFDLVKKYEGSMTAEHNDGLVRGPFLKHMFGEEVYQIFKIVKETFDPDKIFNPHKKTEATLDYYTKHIRTR